MTVNLRGCTGSRVGWAIVKDPAIAELMGTHISMASGRVQENQLRATHLLQHVLADQGNNIGTSVPSTGLPTLLHANDMFH